LTNVASANFSVCEVNVVSARQTYSIIQNTRTS